MIAFLDTSVLIRFEKNFHRLRTLGKVRVPAIALAEYVRGIEGATHLRAKNRAKRFMARQILPLGIVDFNTEAALAWASLAEAMTKAGLTMKFGDSLIAAQCLAANASIVTADNDFERVPGLKVIRI
ncbi:MAG TPA: type II toxin-antitoxin system VapC family toxin [Verrucomicrobiae bacterium]